ncbi:MAG: FKBP-type peptidyl-prolyl cis-trans isomerase [Verrucomicrobiota bacterium]
MQIVQKSLYPARVLLGLGTSVALSLTAFAEEETNYADMAAPKLFGIMVSQQVGLDQLGFSDEEKQEFLEGMKEGLAGGDVSAIQGQLPRLQEFLQGRAEAAQAALAEENKAATAAFVEDLKNNADVIEDETGFFYEVIEPGEDSKPAMDDEVIVNYKGSLVDGTVFDSSYDRGEPATFPMGGVIPGFSGGLSKIGKGGKVKIYIPAELGYGDNPPPQSPIPPGAMLVFDAEIEDIVSPGGTE